MKIKEAEIGPKRSIIAIIDNSSLIRALKGFCKAAPKQFFTITRFTGPEEIICVAFRQERTNVLLLKSLQS